LGPVREDNNKVTEEAVQRVQAQSKQAKQIAQQIKKDKAINNQLARFLTLLMQKIENEELIKAIVSTFFKTTDQRNQITYLRKDINIYVVV
jgi:DNA-binding transcriptional regulator GbsR (MarR family)